MNKTVANEVKNAYSDCHEYKAGARNLDFRASEPVSLTEAVKIMKKYVPGYNEFNPELLWQLPKDVEVVIAREGSVCVYVQLPKSISNDSTIMKAVDSMKVDEVNVSDEQLRLWWD